MNFNNIFWRVYMRLLYVIIIFCISYVNAEEIQFNRIEINSYSDFKIKELMSEKEYAAISSRYEVLAKELKLEIPIESLKKAPFNVSLINGFINGENLNNHLRKFIENFKKNQHQRNEMFLATFFHKNNLVVNIHEQSFLIAFKNNKNAIYHNINSKVLELNLMYKYFPDLMFIDKQYYGYAFSYFLYLQKYLDSKIYNKIIGEFNKIDQSTIKEIMKGYETCEKYWFKSVLKSLLNEKWIIGDKDLSLVQAIKEIWNKEVSPLVVITKDNPLSIQTNIFVPFNKNIYNLLFKHSKATNISHKNLKLIFEKVSQAYAGKNKTLSSIETRYLFDKLFSEGPTIRYSFGSNPLSVLIDMLIALNEIAFEQNMTSPYVTIGDDLIINKDDFVKSGVALYLTLQIIEKYFKKYPIIEYLFYAKIIRENNMEKFIFAKHIITSLKNEYVNYFKTNYTRKEILSDSRIRALDDLKGIIRPLDYATEEIPMTKVCLENNNIIVTPREVK